MILDTENKKVSLAECRKILNTRGVHYTDEEVLEIREWLYHIIEIILDANEREESKRLNETIYKQAA